MVNGVTIGELLDGILGESQTSETCLECPDKQCDGCVFAKAASMDPELDTFEFMSQMRSHS